MTALTIRTTNRFGSFCSDDSFVYKCWFVSLINTVGIESDVWYLVGLGWVERDVVVWIDKLDSCLGDEY